MSLPSDKKGNKQVRWLSEWMLAVKPDDLSLLLGTLMVEEEGTSSPKPCSVGPLRACTAPTFTHKQTATEESTQCQLLTFANTCAYVSMHPHPYVQRHIYKHTYMCTTRMQKETAILDTYNAR